MKTGNFPRTVLSAAVLAALSSAPSVYAQETTSGIRGVITGPNGNPVNNATVIVIHEPSNSRSELSTNAQGRFSIKGLRVGGPYRVEVQSAKGTRKVDDLFLSLGGAYPLSLSVGSQTIEEVSVVAKQVLDNTATGPSSTFNLADLEGMPSIGRDIKDVLRIDPRVYIDEAFSDSIQCAGANPRFNSLTVDGVKMNDNFGLNSNGYPTERMPFPLAAINQVAIELAPFDVQYGGFSACNINAVTTSGSNEFHGSVFYDYTDDSLVGDELEGDSIDNGTFEEKHYGFSVRGPIIPDKLFFAVTYEEFEGAEIFDRGAADSSAAVPVRGVSQAQVDEIFRIARDVYNYNPGGFPASLPVDDEKLLVKLDWNISDQQRAAFTYSYNDGITISQADGDADELEFSKHFYERGGELNSYVGHLFSDWTDTFSTELKVGYSEVDYHQTSLGGTDFGEVQIRTANDHDGDGNTSSATVYLGADDSRHANKLDYETYNFKFTGTLLLGDHTLFAGVEWEKFEVYNKFIQEAEGEYRFNSISDFEQGIFSRITYENATPSNIPEDAAKEFAYDITTFYVQDEYIFPAGNVTIKTGLRYDRYSSSDKPNHNADFATAYGFSNSQNLDGVDLLQPRFGIEWSVNEQLEVHGGIGLYSGGNPNVWISNNYANDGVSQIEVQDRNSGGVSLFSLPFNGQGRPIYDIPQHLFDEVTKGNGTAGINVQDPDFDIPSVWKYALGASYEFENGYVATADLLYSKNKDSAVIRDLSREQVGTAIDGRPIYGSANGRRQDFMLTNVSGDSGSSLVLSLGLSKSFDFGLDVAIGYAYTDTEEVSPMNSSVAFSNYTNIATANPEAPDLARSSYEIPHRFTLRLDYTREFFDGYSTRFTLFGSANEGRPYSYTFDDGDIFGDSVGFESRSLLYVPTGVNDPNVIFAPGFDTDAFFDFVSSEGLDKGGIMDRNDLDGDWWTKVDLRISQELPGFRPEDRASAYIAISNLGNLLNDDWGVMKEASFPRYQPAVDASINSTTGQYEFNQFLDPAGQTRERDPSLWKVLVGIKYDF